MTNHSPQFKVNSLFSKWLKTWRDEAADKGIKTQYSYAKALRSLNKYPLPLSSANECKLLDGFGSKICQLLDDELSKYNAQKAARHNDGSFSDIDSSSEGESGAKVPKAKRRKVQASVSSCTRKYIPRKNSGGYAILITLCRHFENRGDPDGHMLKRQLMLEAQPLAEQSFSIPEPGSRYTAWSSMGTLIKKGLVDKSGCPAKYRITESGRQLAQMLLKADDAPVKKSCSLSDDDAIAKSLNSQAIQQTVAHKRSKSSESGAMHKQSNGFNTGGIKSGVGNNVNISYASDVSKFAKPSYEGDDDELPAGIMDFVLPDPPSGDLHFMYVDTDGTERMSKSSAAVIVDDEVGVGFLAKVKYSDLLSSGKRYKLDSVRSGDGVYVFAYLQDSDAPETANPETVFTSSVISKPISSKEVKSSVPLFTSLKTGSVGMSSTSGKMASRMNSVHAPTASHSRETNQLSAVVQPVERKYTFAAGSASSLLDHGVKDVKSKCDETPDCELPPGSFDIILCVDNQEFYANGCRNREQLIKELNILGVRYDVRRLQVGDFVWVAQHHVSGDTKVELILDYVIERKRMDDLASSIIDGRFREQKHRLLSCGLHNAIYLVEDYGSAQHLSIAEDSLKQAVINTQVTDGLFVKRTCDTRASAEYLALMTRHLQSFYSRKTLLGYGNLDASVAAGSLKQDSSCAKLLTFDRFNESSVKTKAVPVLEMFGKTLMQLHGLTPEKAAVILKQYPTPSALFAAYDGCMTDKERAMLFAELKFGVSKRSIGSKLSNLAHLLYCERGPLP